ncbi:MAG: SPFH domain-containing protein [Bacteroidota bacterium]
MNEMIGLLTTGLLIGIPILALIIYISNYKKPAQGKAIITSGVRGTKVALERGIMIIPSLERYEEMDLSIKTIEISRMQSDGLICKDNIRADIKVVFFVRIDKDPANIKKVAQSIGCERASDPQTLRELFEAKFSEAIKTVGKRFDFVELYDNREKFNSEIQNTIGEFLNGYKLDDVSIDYLEQTDIQYLNKDNMLDSEGIRKISERTASEAIQTNLIRAEEEKTIKLQDVEKMEAILEYERQLAEKEERQKREIANVKAKEAAEIAKINEEERLRAELVRIKTDEELAIAEEKKARQVIIALKNKERTEAVENERVEKERLLEATEKEKIVTLAEIEKQRAVEEEKKNIQDVIRDRIAVEKKVVEEEERINDTRVLAAANRLKEKSIIEAQATGESVKIEREQTAEAERLAAEIAAKTRLIEAEAEQEAAKLEAQSRMTIAEAKAAEEAALGKSEAQVIQAKAEAREQEGQIEAKIIKLKAAALREQGAAEAEVTQVQGEAAAKALRDRLLAEAEGTAKKAEAMKKLDGVGKEHEEFKLRLEKDRDIALAGIDVQRDVAAAQAKVLAEALKSANIDIVGGEMEFVNSILKSVSQGKQVDGMIANSDVLSSLRQKLIGNEEATGLLDAFVSSTNGK